jgi:hypothetical protein
MGRGRWAGARGEGRIAKPSFACFISTKKMDQNPLVSLYISNYFLTRIIILKVEHLTVTIENVFFCLLEGVSV